MYVRCVVICSDSICDYCYERSRREPPRILNHSFSDVRHNKENACTMHENCNDFLEWLAKQEDKFMKERDVLLNDSCLVTCLEDFSLINRAILEIRELQEKVADFKSVLKKLRK